MNAINHEELETARQLLADIIDQPLASVPLNADVMNFPAWDSLVHVRILLAIEAETGRQLDSDLISNLKSLQDIADALRKR